MAPVLTSLVEIPKTYVSGSFYFEVVPLVAHELLLLGLLLLPLDLHLLVEVLDVLDDVLLVFAELEVLLAEGGVIDGGEQVEQRARVEAGVLHVQLVHLLGGDHLLALLHCRRVHLVDEPLLLLGRQSLDDRLEVVPLRVRVVPRQHQAGSPSHREVPLLVLGGHLLLRLLQVHRLLVRLLSSLLAQGHHRQQAQGHKQRHSLCH